MAYRPWWTTSPIQETWVWLSGRALSRAHGAGACAAVYVASMPLPDATEAVAVEMQASVTVVLGSRVSYLAVHGSAATGDILPSYSDLDLYAVIDCALDLASALELHQRIRLINPRPFSYIQPTFVVRAEPKPLLVPGAFVTLIGSSPPPSAVQSEDLLRQSGEQWLQKLPDLLASDVLDWAFVTTDESRRARLCLTRLKPAVRALVVRAGISPAVAWAAPWTSLLDEVHDLDLDLYELIALSIRTAREKGLGAASEVGSSALRASTAIRDRHL